MSAFKDTSDFYYREFKESCRKLGFTEEEIERAELEREITNKFTRDEILAADELETVVDFKRKHPHAYNQIMNRTYGMPSKESYPKANISDRFVVGPYKDSITFGLQYIAKEKEELNMLIADIGTVEDAVKDLKEKINRKYGSKHIK